MNSLPALQVLLFAGECFAASSMLFVIAALGSRFMRQASTRHLLWLTTFVLLVLFPVAAALAPAAIVIAQRTDPVPTLTAAAKATADEPMLASAPQSDASVTPSAHASPATSPSFMPDASVIVIALSLVWFVGLAWNLLRLVAGMLALQRLRHESRPHALAPGDVPRVAYRGRECELRLAASQDGPMTWGLVRPVILLPRAALAWSRERLQAVLLHELAHVRRRDSVSQTAALVVAAFYWPNPLVSLGLRALRREAEMAADDTVLAFGFKPSAYAEELLQLAAEFRGHGLAVSGVSMASRSSLGDRVKSVLAENQSRKGVTSMDALKITTAGLALTAALVALRPEFVAAKTIDADPAAPAAPVASQSERTAVKAIDIAATAPAPSAVPAAPAAPAAPSDAPPAPDVADAPEPPVPAVVPPVPPVAPVRFPHLPHLHHIYQINGADDVQRMSAADAEQFRADMRRMEAEVARIRPEVRSAVDQAKIEQQVARALREIEPRIRAEVDRAMADARPAVRQALAEAHISERVARALRDVQPQIDEAIARAHAAAHAHVHVEVDNDGDDTTTDQKVDGDR